MKRDKFKKMRLQLETLEPVGLDECVLGLQGLTMEIPERLTFSMESVEEKDRRLVNGTLVANLETKRIRSDDRRIAHLKARKQAEILDYNYFRSKMAGMVITDIEAQVFNFRKARIIPFAVKRLEFSFSNGKKIDMTNKVNVLSKDRLAS